MRRWVTLGFENTIRFLVDLQTKPNAPDLQFDRKEHETKEKRKKNTKKKVWQGLTSSSMKNLVHNANGLLIFFSKWSYINYCILINNQANNNTGFTAYSTPLHGVLIRVWFMLSLYSIIKVNSVRELSLCQFISKSIYNQFSSFVGWLFKCQLRLEINLPKLESFSIL